MNHKGRLLHQITDRMVSYNSLFLSLFLDFSHKVSHSIISLLWSQMWSVCPPAGHSKHNQPPAERLLSCPCPVSSTSTAASSRSLQGWWTWLQSENLAEVGLLFGLYLGLMAFCLFLTQILCLCWSPNCEAGRAKKKKRSNFKGLFTHAVKKVISGNIRKMIHLFFCLVSQMTRCGYFLSNRPWD